MNRRTAQKPVINSVRTGIVKKGPETKSNSPASTVLGHYSPYPFYFYNRLVFPVGVNRLIINNPLTNGQSYLIKSLLIQYPEMHRYSGEVTDGNLFNYEVNVELYKIENNRVLMNEPIPVNNIASIGRYGVQISASASVADVLLANIKQYDVLPVAPQTVYSSAMRIGNSMAIDEMCPSSGNVFLVISRTIQTDSPYLPPHAEIPMMVDVVVKGVYVPNPELKQKAY